MLLTISSDGMLIDAYFFELTAFAKLHCHNIYPALQNMQWLDCCTLMQHTALKAECVAQAGQRTAGKC
jgi:hypothetical protein